MEEYKCPICGSKEAVDVALLSTNDSISIERFGNNSYGSPDYCQLRSRGLINWGVTVEGRIDFSSQVSTKICTKCGFVSFHALNLASAIANDLSMLQEKDAELLAEKERLLEEKTVLQAELDAIPAQQKQLEELIKSEDITIRQQKEYQAELERIEARKIEISKRIKDIDSRIAVISYNRILLNKAKTHAHGHSIDEILTRLK